MKHSNNPDIYGIGAAIKASIEIYLRSARSTGRTTHLINTLRDGDGVIFHNESHKKHFISMLKELKPRSDVTLMVVRRDSGGSYDLNRLKPVSGVMHFDHSFIEEYYEGAVKHAQGFFNHIADKFSNEPERELRVMREAGKWRI